MGPSLSLLLLQLGLAATPITISEVGAVREGDQLAITIKGDAAIEPDAATAKLTDGHLYLYVREARVTEGNRAWGEGPAEIRAHRHKHMVELSIPLGENGCQGEVKLDQDPGGLRALVSCDEAAVPASHSRRVVAAVSAPAVAPRAAVAAEPKVAVKTIIAKVAVKPEALVRAPAREAVALKAALVLQPPPAAAELAPKKPQAIAALVSPAPSFLAAATPTSTSTSTSVLAATPAGSMPALQTVQSSSGGGHNGGVVLAGLLLCGLAAGSFFFARRRAKGSRYITIIETASLGPKRAIIVARIGEATLVLGSSEAGITVLQSLPEAKDRSAARAALANLDLAASLGADLRGPALVRSGPSLDHDHHGDSAGVDIDIGLGKDGPHEHQDSSHDSSRDEDLEHPGQGGLLARLFKPTTAAGDSSSPSSSTPSFESLLEDSLEDQELRRKLSLGLAGRTR